MTLHQNMSNILNGLSYNWLRITYHNKIYRRIIYIILFIFLFVRLFQVSILLDVARIELLFILYS